MFGKVGSFEGLHRCFLPAGEEDGCIDRSSEVRGNVDDLHNSGCFGGGDRNEAVDCSLNGRCRRRCTILLMNWSVGGNACSASAHSALFTRRKRVEPTDNACRNDCTALLTPVK